MELYDNCNPQLRRLFNRLGWTDMAATDAISASTRFPADFTLIKWIRPAGTIYVNVPSGWDTLPPVDRISLARETGARIAPGDTAAQAAEADKIIGLYLSGTTHPSAER